MHIFKALNIYKEYSYISLWLCLLGKFFKWKIYKSQEKEIFRQFLREKRYHVFVNYSWILPIGRILMLFLLACFGIHELFLFLFVQKLAPQIYSYFYLQEKLLFADHLFWFQICFRNQFWTLGSGLTENMQIRVFVYFLFDHFPKSKIDFESRFEMRMPIFLF